MRRSAFNLTIPALCAVLTLALASPTGEAHPQRKPAASASPSVSTPPRQQPQPKAKPAPRPTIAPRPRERSVLMEVTAYCACKKCCGPKAQGITASGKRVSHNNGVFVAADTALLPFHTMLKIPGYAGGRAVPVLDRGGAIKGNRLDVYFPSHQQALKWGRQILPVTVVE